MIKLNTNAIAIEIPTDMNIPYAPKLIKRIGLLPYLSLKAPSPGAAKNWQKAKMDNISPTFQATKLWS